MGGSPFTPEERERGLLALVLNGGSCTKASRYLEQTDDLRKVSAEVLRSWRDAHWDRYREIQTEVAPKIAELIAAEAEETAIRAAEAERLAIKRTIETMDQLPAKDAAGAARNMAVVKGIQIEKAGLLRGRPTSIIESRSPSDILGSIAKKLGFSIDGEAVEENKELEQKKR